MAESAVSLSGSASEFVTISKQEVESSTTNFTVKVTLKAAKEIPWNTIYIIYDIQNTSGGKTNPIICSNFVQAKGPIAAGAETSASMGIFRDKPAGKRSILIQDITNVNPAP